MKNIHGNRSKEANKNYLRYVIIAHQRSASSMVSSSLNQHSQVIGFSELFVPGRIGFGVEGYDCFSEEFLNLRKRDPIKFLEKVIFTPHENHIRAVGFKIFPDQIDNKDFDCVYKYLQENKNIAVIKLKRINLLETYVSLQIAITDNVWGVWKSSQRTDIKITVNPEQMKNEFVKREKLNEKINSFIEEHKKLEINYEEIAQNPSSAMINMQKFLGIDIETPSISSLKKESRPMNEVIKNYKDLKKEFMSTRWASFFNDDN